MKLTSLINFHSRPKTYSKPRFFNLRLDSDTKKSAKGLSPKFLKKVFPNSTLHGSFNIDKSYPSNYISTTKYNLFTFFPKCLFFQFHRIANIYFLLTAILQCFPEISPLHPFSAISPFIFVITLSLFREALEDYERFKSDRETNNSFCMLLCSGVPLQHQWSEVQVGNILLIKDQEMFPSDIILLASSLETGMCYIETSSLDGEKGLKAKQVVKETIGIKNNQNLKEALTWEFECPSSDPLFYSFEAMINMKSKGIRVMLNAKQFLPRGAKLKNTQWILGVAVYTGFDTKLMRNAEKSKIKKSNIDKKTNKYIFWVLIFQLFCCILSAIGYVIWNDFFLNNHYYLHGESFLKESYFFDWLFTFFTYFILNNTMIPISLIVSLEFVKLAQSFFINQDEDMHTPSNNRNCKVMTSSINEELGQVQYIFSDKTGTLTCNKMQFKMILIGNQIYGSEKYLFQDNVDLDLAEKDKVNSNTFINQELKKVLNSKRNSNIESPGLSKKKPKIGIVDERSNVIYDFNDPTLRSLIKNSSEMISSHDITVNPSNELNFWDLTNQIVLYELKDQKQLVAEFLKIMACCHDCIIEKHEASNYIHYQGQSPDEIALVDAVRHLGYKFLGISNSFIQIEILGNIKEVELLHTFEFNSDRKRMSMLIKENGILKLYMKGADSKIKEKLNATIYQPFLKSIEERIDLLSKKGYRILCFAMRVVTIEEYEEFLKKLEAAKSLPNREAEILKLADELEKGSILLGATGVEDKLQDNVPETIHDFLSARIKFWMLTGDKLETAENIGKSCQLIEPDMTIIRISQKSLEDCMRKMDECIDIYKLCIANNRKKAFLIEGDALNILLTDRDLTEKFIYITKDCEAVICCRVTPRQKAQVVRLIKINLKKVTLAIGDGANDVNMIQEADIGIGIYGQEGLRAVQSSDFAIGEFKCLWKLLLIHGRWSYIRISEMIFYFFYKNMTMTFPQFIYSFYCCFSGQTLWDDYYITFYNMLFTLFPSIISAILDQDVYYKEAIHYGILRKIFPKTDANKEKKFIKKYFPKLYYIGQNNKIFNFFNFLKWIVWAIYHSILFFYLNYLIYDENIMNIDGQNSDFWAFSITFFSIIILAVNFELGLYTKNWTFIFFLCLFLLSIFVYFSYVWVSDNIDVFACSYSANNIFSSFIFYGSLFLIVGIAFIIELFMIVVMKEIYPTIIDYYRILIKTKQYENEQYFFKFQNQEENPIYKNKNFQTPSPEKRKPSIFFRDLSEKNKREERNEKINMKRKSNSLNCFSENFAKIYLNSDEYKSASEFKQKDIEDEGIISEDYCVNQRKKSDAKSKDQQQLHFE